MQMSPVIAVHMTASLIALVIGPIAMWARLGQTKRPWIHRAIGYGWVSMMIVSAVSAIFIRDYGLTQYRGLHTQFIYWSLLPPFGLCMRLEPWQ